MEVIITAPYAPGTYADEVGMHQCIPCAAFKVSICGLITSFTQLIMDLVLPPLPRA